LRRSLKDFPEEMWVDPVTKKRYGYDPATGTLLDPPADTAPAQPGQAPAPPAPAQPGAPNVNIPQPQEPIESE
jgi:hypothetical protein